MTARRSLLLITERFAPELGGVARSAERTARALCKLGFDVHVVAWTRLLMPGELQSLDLIPNLETETSEDETAATGSLTVHRVGLFANWDRTLQHTLNVLEWLHGEVGFKAVWGHYLHPAGFLAVMFAGLVGVPSTVSARGNDVDRLMFPPGDFARLLWTLDRASVVTAVSRELLHKVEVVLGRKPLSVVLPNVVVADVFSPSGDVAELASLRQRLGIDDAEAVLGFCGELRHKKGMPFLLTALVEVRREQSACLLVIGDVRPHERAAISAFALEQPESASRILVTGHLEAPAEVAQHLRLCDVVLQPSVWDGLPNALLEAMSCERVVIGSDAGGIAEVIEHGVSGFVIPKAHLHRLGEAVREVLGLTVEERRIIGQAARQRMLSDFAPKSESARLCETLALLEL